MKPETDAKIARRAYFFTSLKYKLKRISETLPFAAPGRPGAKKKGRKDRNSAPSYFVTSIILRT